VIVGGVVDVVGDVDAAGDGDGVEKSST